MKYLLLVFIGIFLASCQHDAVPEITLNAQQHFEVNKRIFQEKILYEAPLISQEKVQVYIYAGSVHYIKQDGIDQSEIRLDNAFKKPFLFEADSKLRSKISPNMDLIVRYYIKNGAQHLVEVRKKTL